MKPCSTIALCVRPLCLAINAFRATERRKVSLLYLFFVFSNEYTQTAAVILSGQLRR